MAYTLADVGPRNVSGKQVELSDAEKQIIVDQWNTPEVDNRTYDEKRKEEYPSLDSLIVALWEGVVEERMASVTTLEGLRQSIKTKYPKV
jgi:hypothetical protein